MNRLEQLIKELCPDGVELRTIREVCKNICSGGTPNSKNKSYYNGNIPWLRTQEVNFCAISETDMKITEEGLANSSAKWVPENSIIVAMYGATVGKVAYTTIPLTTNQACCNLEVDKEKALFKFVYYWLSDCYDYIKSLGQGSQTNINAQIVKDLKIPVPPPEVQAEIVRILDEYSEKNEKLIQELYKEIDLRKKQYAYYRDSLLDFGDEVEWKTLGEITKVFSASRVHKNEWTKSGVPFFRSSDVIAYFNGVDNSRGNAYISFELYEKLSNKSGKIKKGDILITGGGTIGIPFLVKNNEPLYVKDADLLCIQKCEQLNSKFLYHYFLSTNFRNYLMNITHDATIAHYTISQINQTPVPIPPIAEQERIVAILDRFDSLCNGLTEGLPAEIAARRRQYEYYRNRLLAFGERNHQTSGA